MFYQILTKIFDSVYINESPLPRIQKEVLDKFGAANRSKWSKISTFVDEGKLVRFWLLNNGKAIHVPYIHIYIGEDEKYQYKCAPQEEKIMAKESEQLSSSGAVRINASIGRNRELDIEHKKKLTLEQVDWLVDFGAYHNFRSLVADGPFGWTEVPIKSIEHLRFALEGDPRDLLVGVDEATTNDIRRKQRSVTRLFPTFPDRVRKVEDMGGLRLKDIDPTVWHWKIHSGTKNGVWYDGKLSFKNVIPTLAKLVRDRRLWVRDKSRADLRKLAREFAEVADVEAFCSCPAFQYWGPAYILTKKDAKYTNPEKRPPRVRNPKQYGAVCKHYHVLLKALPFYYTTVAKWLGDFYSRDIAKIEKQVKKEFGWVPKVTKALKRKKEEEEKKPKPEADREPVEKPESEETTSRWAKENRINENKVPKILFHATRSENVDSIKKHGLIAVPDEAFGEDTTKGVNLVSRKSYLPFMIHGGSFIKIDTSGLNPSKFLYLGSGWYRYLDDIDPKHIKAVELINEKLKNVVYRGVDEDEFKIWNRGGYREKSGDLIANNQAAMEGYGGSVPDWAKSEGLNVTRDYGTAASFGEFVLVFDITGINEDEIFNVGKIWTQIRYPNKLKLIEIINLRESVVIDV